MVYHQGCRKLACKDKEHCVLASGRLRGIAPRRLRAADVGQQARDRGGGEAPTHRPACTTAEAYAGELTMGMTYKRGNLWW